MKTRGAGTLAASAAAALACLAAVGLGGRGPSEIRAAPEPLPAPRDRAREPAALLAARAAPESAPSGATEEPGAPSEAWWAERAVAELAALVRAEPFDDAQLLLAARALGHGADPRALETLRTALAEARSPEELLAAAELLRGLVPSDEPAGLSPRALHGLRALAADDPGALGDVAARALAALGPTPDGLELLRELLHEPGPRQERAARALVFARDASLAAELASGLPLVDHPRTLELAVTCLARIAAGRDGDERAAIDAELARLAERAELAPPLRRRILQARSELAPLPLVDEPHAGALSLALGPLSARDLEQPSPELVLHHQAVLLDPSRPAEQRLAAAEAVALAPDRHDSRVRTLAIASLRESLGPASSSAQRRRALYALGSLPSPESTEALVHHARFDADPSVRCAGLRALPRSDPIVRREGLSRAAESDPIPCVRTFAARELARGD